MIYRLLLVLTLIICIIPARAFGAPGPGPASVSDFQKVNPDGKKYNFAYSYISALSYFSAIDQRWKNNDFAKRYAGHDRELIIANINELSVDDMDLRIAKNYMLKYLSSPNVLMRKVTVMMVDACDRGIAVNDENKVLWQMWWDLKKAKQATDQKERDFVKHQQELALKHKEANKGIIQASILMTKVLLSNKNKDVTGHQLAITTQQRDSLLDRLDSFGKYNLDWGLKSGQTTLQASIAVIREVLEDPVWMTTDDKE